MLFRSVWTITTLAMLVVGLPVGYAARRFGSRGPLLLSAAILPLALVGQALAPGLPSLLGARLLFGVSLGILWVVAPARAAAGDRGAGGTGPLIAAAGLGWVPCEAGEMAAELLGSRYANKPAATPG